MALGTALATGVRLCHCSWDSWGWPQANHSFCVQPISAELQVRCRSRADDASLAQWTHSLCMGLHLPASLPGSPWHCPEGCQGSSLLGSSLLCPLTVMLPWPLCAVSGCPGLPGHFAPLGVWQREEEWTGVAGENPKSFHLAEPWTSPALCPAHSWGYFQLPARIGAEQQVKADYARPGSDRNADETLQRACVCQDLHRAQIYLLNTGLLFISCSLTILMTFPVDLSDFSFPYMFQLFNTTPHSLLMCKLQKTYPKSNLHVSNYILFY